MDTSYSNVDVTVRVAGDDVLVTVISGEDVPHISCLRAHIDGVPEPSPEKNSHQTIVVGQPLVYKDLAAGVWVLPSSLLRRCLMTTAPGIITYARIQFN